MKPLTVLLTGCGAPGTAGTITALRQNPDKQPVRIIGVDVDPGTTGQRLVDAFAPVLAPDNIDYRTRLLDVCQRHGVNVVIPQTTAEVGLLGHEEEWFREFGISVMASPAAERANDKRECLIVATSNAVPVPIPEWTDVFNAQALYAAVKRREPDPSVVKPCTSNGSRGVRVITQQPWNRKRFLAEKPSGLECTLESVLMALCDGVSDANQAPFPELLVMDYLPGREYSVDCFHGEHVQLAVPRVRTVMRDGISTDTTIVDEPEMARHALHIGKRLGLTGVYGVQFKANAEGVPCLIEVNPRVQGTMVASVHAGANLVWMGVREALGDPIEQMPTVRVGTRCVRHWVVSNWEQSNGTS